MNIFKIFESNGYRIYESGFSAFLGYLLDTTADHGLSDIFLRSFLTLIKLPFPNNAEKLSSELQIELSIGTRRIDIELILYSDLDKNTPFHKVIIENKVRSGAVRDQQLNDYYNEYLEQNDDGIPISIVLLTPNKSKHAYRVFDDLTVNEKAGHSKKHIHWIGPSSISTILKQLLFKDSIGEVGPLNDQVRHTIKSFRNFMEMELTLSTSYFGKNIGSVILSAPLKFRDGREFTICQRDSGQIQIFDQSGMPVIAKTIMREYINDYGLKLNTSQTVNTRTMGKELINAIIKA